MREIRYTSDTHLSHKNIINFTKRDFASVEAMDLALISRLREAEQGFDARVIHAGDISFNMEAVRRKYGAIFQYPERHIFVAGNHDRVIKQRAAYEAEFGLIVGDEKSWKTNTLIVDDVWGGNPIKVLVSHDPQTELPPDVNYNVYGHVHNNLDHSMKWHIENYGRGWVEWLATSPRHINACVELTRGQPLPFGALMFLTRRFQEKLRHQLVNFP